MPDIRALAPGDAGWVLQRHGEHYCLGLGFTRDFETLVAGILADHLRDAAPERDRGWIAWGAGTTRLGCIFARQIEPGIGQLRLFFVEDAARGRGLGQTLLETLLAHGAACGWHTIRLWTHAEHVEAGRLYRRNGFARMDAAPVVSFGHAMTQERWEKPLRAG